MEFISTAMKWVKAKEMISRFRSKEDLYRFLTQHDKHNYSFQRWNLKEILCDEKKAFKNNEIKLIEIPNYPKISVTNLYEDAMKDEELEVQLLTKKQLQDKLSERIYFFGVLGTLRESFLKENIEEAHKKSYSISPDDQKKQGILISKTQLAELKNHLFLSWKPGTGIFLMKEHAKVHRERKSQTIHEVSKRLYKIFQKPDELNIDAGAGTKRRNMGPSKPQEEEKKEKPNAFMGQFNM